MAKDISIPDLIEGIVQRIPEGFIRQAKLNKKLRRITRNPQFNIRAPHLKEGVGRQGKIVYDAQRLTSEQVGRIRDWYRPNMPAVSRQGDFQMPTIDERLRSRESEIAQSEAPEAFNRILRHLADNEGYQYAEAILQASDQPEDERAYLDALIQVGLLKRVDDLVFDPLRVGLDTINEICRREAMRPVLEQVRQALEQHSGSTAPREALEELVGEEALEQLMSLGSVVAFKVPTRRKSGDATWVRLQEADANAARKVAAREVKISDVEWQEALDFVGEVLRHNADDGKNRRTQVLARSYTENTAARRLDVRKESIQRALDEGILDYIEDPEERVRIPARQVEAVLDDPAWAERIARFEPVTAQQIATVSGLNFNTVRRRLEKERISRTRPVWEQVRGKWNLPDTLQEFRIILREENARLQAEREAELERERLEAEREQQRRDELRTRLVEAFPTWEHEGRVAQRLYLHVGQPNSGKTHDALKALTSAGSGWYLAPLRLLAFEIFDRLNAQGVLCNLLTGEEYIPIPGAQITAATIEMFRPEVSGECVIIDEAQMLADADRGWAWTSAMMGAQAPEIHVIGPETAEELIAHMTSVAGIPLTKIHHERLTPLRLAKTNWPLHKLPPHTILVAFSRRTVLGLKTELERMNRTVSVVYGNLPPEVRRKQADRFASGETEICVATDAVGMGLNLPADRVCFYEVEKFDGRTVRFLNAAEVQQIGGRAGRFGLSEAGEVGATNKRNLALVQQRFKETPPPITHARVAPTVEDLALIPGSLSEQLIQWSELESIPDDLRGHIKTADLTERIELAKMLTDAQVEQLGLADALKLINAPTRNSSRHYWFDCAQAILAEREMPMPPQAKMPIEDSADLEQAEVCISCADIYLWLARRVEFREYAQNEFEVRAMREHWSMEIDHALLQQLDTARRCPSCGRPLPLGHKYKICDECFHAQFSFHGG